MRSLVTADFITRLRQLPGEVRDQATRAYALWQVNPFHPSLQFKRVSQRHLIFSARVGLGYRALGLMEGDVINWFWIGPHAEYDILLARL